MWYILQCIAGPWTARRSSLSILKESSPEYSLEGLMLKLKPQCFGHLKQRANSMEKILMLRKIEGGRRRGDRGWDGWMASLTQWTWVWVGSRSWWWTGRSGILKSMGSQRVRHDWMTELNWTEIAVKMDEYKYIFFNKDKKHDLYARNCSLSYFLY